jgi:hypothetical protein
MARGFSSDSGPGREARMREDHHKLPAIAIVLVCAITLLEGCQQVFTTSLLMSFRRNPQDMSLEEKMTYAQEALSSGDASAMKAAFDALKDAQSGEAQYLCAELAVELSGAPNFVWALAMDTASLYTGSMTELEGYVSEYHIDLNLLIDAADRFQTALGKGMELQPLDYLYGSLGLLFESARKPDGTFDYGNPSALDLSKSIEFIDEGLATLSSRPSGDGTVAFLSTFSDYLKSL